MVDATFEQMDSYQDPTFRVWVGISNSKANLFWYGENLIVAIWNLISAKAKYKGLVRLEWS